ncbi:twin-arginine translocase subunit TatC [Gemmatimonadota bacterium]
MTKRHPKGEMPFLDHLEELRRSILWSLAAIVVGTVIGFVLVQNFDIMGLLKEPIAPFLPDGKLHVTRPTDAFFVTLKLALMIGLVLAAPIVIAQVWGFLSPALYEHEKRYMTPFLIGALGLFIAGVLMAYLWVLPVALRILLTKFQSDYLAYIITAREYFAFASQLIIAFGLMFEVPVVMVFLSAIGIVSPATFSRQRPYAVVVASILAALLTPPDVMSMMMLMLPVVLLYEVGILIGRLVWKKRAAKP